MLVAELAQTELINYCSQNLPRDWRDWPRDRPRRSNCTVLPIRGRPASPSRQPAC